jgi:hypothetical protein
VVREDDTEHGGGGRRAAGGGRVCRFLDAAKVLELVPWHGGVAPGSSMSGDAGHRGLGRGGEPSVGFWGRIETSRRLEVCKIDCVLGRHVEHSLQSGPDLALNC